MTDVLIIGGGLAGRRAAEAAVKAGASVRIVSNGVGNSPDIHALNCPVLPEDSVDCYFEDTMRSGHYENDPELVRIMCERSVELKDEFEFDLNTIIRPVGSTVPRCVSINHSIGRIALERITERLSGKVEVEKGTVDHIDFTMAKAIVIATGGWCGKYDFSTNPEYLKGDGIRLAESLGAKIADVDEEHVQYEPTVRIEGPMRGIPVITTLLHEGAKLLTPDGKEFMKHGQLNNKDELSRAIFDIGGKAIYDLSGVPEAKLLACKMDPSMRRITVAPAPHSSLGGIVIDTQCRTTVPGLYASGEVTAGIHGRNRLGGNGGTAAMVFGKIAGEAAAKYVKQLNS